MVLASHPRRPTADWSDRIIHRLGFLQPHDRALLQQVIGDGVRTADIARVTGLSTRTIQRRVRQLCQRLTSPEVETIIRHHRRWPRPLARVALCLYVQGLTQRQTARQLRLSLHRVRQLALAARAQIDGPAIGDPDLHDPDLDGLDFEGLEIDLAALGRDPTEPPR